jgi:hypothetical protein
MTNVAEISEPFLTHHSVDDVAMSADEAIAIFKKYFPIPSLFFLNQRAQIAFPNLRMANEYKNLARGIIVIHNLPLQVVAWEHTYGSQIKDCYLSISFKSKSL